MMFFNKIKTSFELFGVKAIFFLNLSTSTLIFAPALSAQVKCPSFLEEKLTPEEYCKKYSSYAVKQMKEHGIPASITLAQGMYESGYGSSYLAVMGNNHFGIKSYRMSSLGWSGKVIYCDDDNVDDPFCTFKSVKDSYEWHSKFLLGNTRYASLFKLKSNDYKGWAKGLSKCGYATDPEYTNKIVNIIERNKLYSYDGKSGKNSYIVGRHTKYLTAKKHGLYYTKVLADDDLESIAQEFGIKVKKLRKWNDLNEQMNIKEGDIIYLHKKHSKALKGYETHVVGPGDSMWGISQAYGVTIWSIMKRNKLKSYQLQLGQILKLR